MWDITCHSHWLRASQPRPQLLMKADPRLPYTLITVLPKCSLLDLVRGAGNLQKKKKSVRDFENSIFHMGRFLDFHARFRDFEKYMLTP